MSYLLYCIVRGDHPELQSEGVRIMARCAGLGAVLRETSRQDLEPSVENLLHCAEVIESYDREGSVIPMRFGCVFEELTEVSELLERRQDAYRRLLSELDGRTEMSVRVALDQQARESLESTPVKANDAEAGPSCGGAHSSPSRGSGAGIRYLTNRRHYYSIRDSAERSRDELARQIVSLAEGTFVQWKSEHTKRDGELAVEVHFLVPREGVARFVNALGELKRERGSSLTVSGPWPAYNFANLSA